MPPTQETPSPPKSAQQPWLYPAVRIALCASLTLSALCYFLFSWRWPLVGDASLIHYIGFLIERGWAPYRQLGDMNMPGSFLIELAAMRLFGAGDLGWRLFDFFLMLSASAAFVTVCGRNHRFSALFASSLFIVLHGRDGLAEGGQRDLTMAVCLLAATAFLFLAVRRNSPSAAAAFGVLSGIAMTIKPTALPLTAVQMTLAVAFLRHNPQPRPLRYVPPATLAYLIGPLIALLFLLREHALPAFFAGFHGILPYYASLGHRPFPFVLLHSVSPILPLVLIWFALLALSPSTIQWTHDWERNALLAGALFGVAACVLQQRALPYYRYPLLAFLLPLMALDFTRAFARAPKPSLAPTVRTRITHLLSLAALLFGGFFLAPQSAILIHRYRWWETYFISTLQQRLQTLGGPSLSGHIQCIDSISGCGNVLYRMRLEPATGVLSDFLLFGPDTVPIVRQTRAEFSQIVFTHPPQIIVVTSHLHIDGPDNYQKLARWPAFATFLADRYTLDTEWSPTRTARWWSREETPASYRIYVLKQHP